MALIAIYAERALTPLEEIRDASAVYQYHRIANFLERCQRARKFAMR